MSDDEDDVFFTLEPDTLAEANRIGDNMPEGWNFEFEEEDD